MRQDVSVEIDLHLSGKQTSNAQHPTFNSESAPMLVLVLMLVINVTLSGTQQR
jgi:hypothetical protein